MSTHAAKDEKMARWLSSSDRRHQSNSAASSQIEATRSVERSEKARALPSDAEVCV